MALSEEQIKIIADHPLKDLLARFPTKLRTLTESTRSWRAEIAGLLGALVMSPAAYNLHLPQEGGNVATKLFPIQQNVQGGSLGFSHFHPLINTVVAKRPDTNLWTAVSQ